MNPICYTALIRTCNSAQTLPKTLASLRAQATPPSAHVIVDSGSSDTTLGLVPEGAVVHRYVGEHFNYAEALNQGLNHVATDYVLIISAHTSLRKTDSLSYALHILSSDDRISAAYFCYEDAEALQFRLIDTGNFTGFNGLWNTCALIKTSLLMQRPFRTEVFAAEDQEWAHWLLYSQRKVIARISGGGLENENPKRYSHAKRLNEYEAVARFTRPDLLNWPHLAEVTSQIVHPMGGLALRERFFNLKLMARLLACRFSSSAPTSEGCNSAPSETPIDITRAPDAGADEVLGDCTKPKLLIAARVLGASGQPWLWRQVIGLSDFRNVLMCWERRIPGNSDPLAAYQVHVMQQEAAPCDGKDRWWYRLRNTLGGNFYAALGRDRSELVDVLHKERPDAILCYFGDVAMRLLPLARRERIPVIAYLHGDFLFNSDRWYRASLKHCAKQFAFIVTVTEAERRWLIEQDVAVAKVKVIPCGAPIDFFHPASQAKDGPIQFVMCSRLVDGKGCDLTIRAFARVVSATQQVQLQIYGDGPARTQLEKLVVSLGLCESVFFHGYVDEHQIAEALPSCDVFVQHSLTKEGSPVSIAEAMACGLPIVTTPVGGIAEQVVDGLNGLLVQERDVDAMFLAMHRLAVNRDLRLKLGQAGHRRATTAFDCSRQTHRLAQVIRQTLWASRKTEA
jgi:glycosyltransferase involved in cell wall biosynthesis